MAQPTSADLQRRNPEHKVEVEPSPRWVRAVVNGETIVNSKRAKLLCETGSRPVYYFPKEDVRTALLEATDHHTRCPYKG